MTTAGCSVGGESERESGRQAARVVEIRFRPSVRYPDSRAWSPAVAVGDLAAEQHEKDELSF